MEKGSAPDPKVELLREVLERGGWLRCRAVGSSMRPLLRSGDGFEVEGCDPSALRPGDVVLLGTPGGLVVHRFLFRSPLTGHLITKGDGRVGVDPPRPPGCLLGRVRKVCRALPGGRSATFDPGSAGARVAGLSFSLASSVLGVARRVLPARLRSRRTRRLPGLQGSPRGSMFARRVGTRTTRR